MIKEHVPLAPYTTFRLGGPGRFFASVGSIDQLKEALAFARERGLPVFILGGGSNVLVRDEGWSGIVIKMECRGIERVGSGYIAAAGELWDTLCARAARDGLWGIENLSGIPGTVGGACVQNIGAYGAALSQVLEWVEAYDTQTGEVARFTNAACAFGYRTSLFKHRDRYVVLRASCVLSVAPNPNLEYRDPNKAYKDMARMLSQNTNPSLGDIRQAILAIRADKFPDVAREGTAGSFFLNPILPQAEAEALKERYPDMPLFAMPETGSLKVPLGWLLDHVLGLKGMQVGGARLYERQALVVAASRTASARDVLALRDKVKQEVKNKIGIDISEEVTIL